MGSCCSSAEDHAVGNPNPTSGRESPENADEWLESLEPAGTGVAAVEGNNVTSIRLAQFEASNSAASLLHRSSGTAGETPTKRREGRNPFRDPGSSTSSIHSRSSRSVTFIGAEIVPQNSGPAAPSPSPSVTHPIGRRDGLQQHA